jgi:hypothetical protein
VLLAELRLRLLIRCLDVRGDVTTFGRLNGAIGSNVVRERCAKRLLRRSGVLRPLLADDGIIIVTSATNES